MKRIILVLLMVAAMFASCKKSDSNNVTPGGGSGGGGGTTVTTGTIQFVNNSTNPYKCYISGTLVAVLSGGYNQTFTKAFGTYSCEVIQSSGYVLYPTDKTYSATVSASANAVISFP